MTLNTLLAQADCWLCEHAKTVLAKIGRDMPVTVEEVDLGRPEGQARADSGWLLFAPGVLSTGSPSPTAVGPNAACDEPSPAPPPRSRSEPSWRD